MNVLDRIKTWAYDKDAPPPSQDHELTLISLGVNELLLELACDDQCPKKRDFLYCLYLLVGDAVMPKGGETSFEEVERLLKLAERKSSPLVEIWRQRSQHLLAHPNEFDYSAWCGGSLAKTP